MYAFGLKANYGVDIAPAELARIAHAGYAEIQARMQPIAARVAQQRGFPDPDYRAVIRQLKKEQVVGEAILPLYQETLRKLEEIIRRERLVTLPERPARIRLATPAESAQQPAPNMRPPRLIGNTGEQGEFVLPLNIPAKDPGAAEDLRRLHVRGGGLDAHGPRGAPGARAAVRDDAGERCVHGPRRVRLQQHERRGLGPVRGADRAAVHAARGPADLAAAPADARRAGIFDPELQAGQTTPEKVKALLMKDVVLSDATATQEVERYTFRAPGQATSYFYGYTRLNELRADVEKQLDKGFDQQAFHDFVLSQGLLPPALLRKAVMEEFVATRR